MGTQIKAPCVIIGAGEISDYGKAAGCLPPGAFVICADGGLTHCEKLGLRPDLIVGDFDSFDGPLPKDAEIIRLSPCKNYTDSFHAAEEALARGYREIILTGMLGGRLDHTMANLALLAHLAQAGASALLTDSLCEARALAGPGELILPPREGGYFSLISMGNCRGVTITGGKYPLADYDLAATDPRAISNEFTGKEVSITQREGTLVVISF